MTYLFNVEKNSIRNKRGFTLIELLIVMVLLGLSISLLAPDMHQTFNKVKSQNEIAIIKSEIKIQQEESFFKSSYVEIHFKENKILIKELSEGLKVNNVYKTFFIAKHIEFEDTIVHVNKGEWEGIKVIKLTKNYLNKSDETLDVVLAE